MCLAIAAKIIELNGENAKADFGGIVRDISLMLMPDLKVGDAVLVHAGFAIQKISVDAAMEIQNLRKEMNMDAEK
ncbi:MAG: HypC/HybG/HupF family hydrogenase formation chaperone [Clostridia bacterium]|jgi:hydrogenase expression/formation protein HypC|nr:HypC/HybG/HupF family hydrogenase formation chaperone [Clostridia bacterium]MDD4572232.1 HypC/HybG/HupF family hydrogenase formation chaperone [Clostridia bacterium]